ncbi:VOC family protein [Mycobacterium sp.]|uniref:VOC family protein n=1 Tax=Mycobacterium sp. TaxID=1785 RepID=UPI002BFCBFAB|nr:VOC family protein [Mycobacterium sp.]HTH90320.1 VOC family protein [Mycobacterium sp.]
MSLHRLTHLVIGVPNLDDAAKFYTDFGLTPVHGPGAASERRFGTVDGGEQLILVRTPIRRLVEIGVAAQDRDDLRSIQSRLARLNIDSRVDGAELATVEPATGIAVKVAVAEPLQQKWQTAEQNYPGDIRRPDVRAPALYRETQVRPRKLGHVVFGSTDYATSKRFFMDGLGFRLSDEVQDIGAFMRCSPDHHNVLVQAAPVSHLHHTSWEVEDIDEIGRGAQDLLAEHPERHVWGIGRHWIGSNFFWYFRDPAGNMTEYYSDMDEVIDDQIWEPGIWGQDKSPNHWGPPMPPSMINPDDLAELMAGLH